MNHPQTRRPESAPVLPGADAPALHTTLRAGAPNPPSTAGARPAVDGDQTRADGTGGAHGEVSATALGKRSAPTSPPRVIGLDLSLTATGITLLDGQPITLSPGKGLTGVPRLRELRGAIVSIVVPSAELVVVEGPAYSRALGAGHHEGAGLWWLIATMLEMHDIPYAIVTPGSLKKYATGKGSATKADMRMALYQRAGVDLRDDNQVDAFWLRAMGLDHLGYPVVEVPKTHRAALDKVDWPAVTP